MKRFKLGTQGSAAQLYLTRLVDETVARGGGDPGLINIGMEVASELSGKDWGTST